MLEFSCNASGVGNSEGCFWRSDFQSWGRNLGTRALEALEALSLGELGLGRAWGPELFRPHAFGLFQTWISHTRIFVQQRHFESCYRLLSIVLTLMSNPFSQSSNQDQRKYQMHQKSLWHFKRIHRLVENKDHQLRKSATV